MLRRLPADLPASRTPWELLLRTQLARHLALQPALSWSQRSRSCIANEGRAGPAYALGTGAQRNKGGAAAGVGGGCLGLGRCRTAGVSHAGDGSHHAALSSGAGPVRFIRHTRQMRHLRSLRAPPPGGLSTARDCHPLRQLSGCSRQCVHLPVGLLQCRLQHAVYRFGRALP